MAAFALPFLILFALAIGVLLLSEWMQDRQNAADEKRPGFEVLPPANNRKSGGDQR